MFSMFLASIWFPKEEASLNFAWLPHLDEKHFPSKFCNMCVVYMVELRKMLYGVCMVLILYIQRKEFFLFVVFVFVVFVERGWTILNII